MKKNDLSEKTEAVRHFNRFYTKQIAAFPIERDRPKVVSGLVRIFLSYSLQANFFGEKMMRENSNRFS